MERSQVEDKVAQILREVIGFNITKETSSESLLSPQFGFNPRDLFALFHELEEAFEVKFVEDDITTRRFDIFSNIVDSIMLKIC